MEWLKWWNASLASVRPRVQTPVLQKIIIIRKEKPLFPPLSSPSYKAINPFGLGSHLL
jgi:hypothetical protein